MWLENEDAGLCRYLAAVSSHREFHFTGMGVNSMGSSYLIIVEVGICIAICLEMGYESTSLQQNIAIEQAKVIKHVVEIAFPSSYKRSMWLS